MRALRVMTITLIALASCIGVVFADDPLEIHGGGRVGVVVTGKGGGSDGNTGPSNEVGSMPGYGQTRYWNLAISKKFTGDDGSWAKYSTNIDKWLPTTFGDLDDQTFRMREAQVQFGGLDFLPKGAVLWGGLRPYGGENAYNGQQDHGFIALNGIGFGVQNLGGLFSIAYMKQDLKINTNGYGANQPPYTGVEAVDKLGNRTLHNFIASVNVPLVDVYGMLGYSPAADSTEKAVTQYYVAAVGHLPVGGLNVGALYATGSYAFESQAGYNSDTALQQSCPYGQRPRGYSGVDADKANKYSMFSATAWSITDIMPGLYIAPAIRADFFTADKETAEGVANGDKALNTTQIGASFRLSKSLTKNISIVPVLGYWYTKNDAPQAKALMFFQQTLALEIALSQGFWSSPKLQFYVSEMEINKDAKEAGVGWLGAAYVGKSNGTILGCLVTFGF
jgi:maltoporin